MKINKNELGNTIGILGWLREILFKFKDIENKKSKGVRCDNFGKQNIEMAINNTIKNTETDITIFDFDKLTITIRNTLKERLGKINTGGSLCMLFEMMLRYFNYIHLNNKRWFFDFEETILLDLQKKIE